MQGPTDGDGSACIAGQARRVRVFFCLVLVASCGRHSTKPGTDGYMVATWRIYEAPKRKGLLLFL